MNKIASISTRNLCVTCRLGLQDCQCLLKAGKQKDTESECWLPVVGFEGLYEVSSEGQVRSLDREASFDGRWGTVKRKHHGGTLRPLRHTGGYQRVMLWRDGKATQTYIHKVVLEAFVGDRPNGMQVAHMNGNKQDNRLANLSWATPTENQMHREAHGTGRIGKPHPIARVGLDMARIIRRVYAASGLNISELARCFEIPRTTVADILNNKVWKD